MLQQERRRAGKQAHERSLSLIFFSRAKLFPPIAVTHRNRAELAIEEKMRQRRSDVPKADDEKKRALNLNSFNEVIFSCHFFRLRGITATADVLVCRDEREKEATREREPTTEKMCVTGILYNKTPPVFFYLSTIPTPLLLSNPTNFILV